MAFNLLLPLILGFFLNADESGIVLALVYYCWPVGVSLFHQVS